MVNDQQVSPPPGLLRRISDARYKLYRKLSQAKANEEQAVGSGEGDLNNQIHESKYEVKKGWLPPLFMYSNWAERLKSIMVVEKVEELQNGENAKENYSDSQIGTERDGETDGESDRVTEDSETLEHHHYTV